MKSRARWVGVSYATAALMVGMLLVMWAQQPSSDCALPPEASRRLILSRETDREHLMRDLASADRIARRHTASAPGDARPETRFLECETAMIQQIAARHGMPVDQLRASAQRLQGLQGLQELQVGPGLP